MSEDLVVNGHVTIPASELDWSFARSGGPGGQNVNKVETKAIVRWRPAESRVLGDLERARLLERLGGRLTAAGEIVLASDEHRERLRNIRSCRERLRALVVGAIARPKRRVATKPTRASKERRLREKRSVAEKKQNRRPPRSGE